MVGLGEEAGWTAFAAPILLRRHGVLGAWAVLAPHADLLAPAAAGHRRHAAVGVRLLGNAGFQLIVLQLMRTSRGAWSLAAVWHATLNAFGGAFFFTMVTGADKDRLGTLLALVYALVALGTVAAMWARGTQHELTVPVEVDLPDTEPSAARKAVEIG